MGEKDLAFSAKPTIAVVVSRNTLWTEHGGRIREKIFVYFYNEAPPNLLISNNHVTHEFVMTLLEEWKCDDVKDRDGRQIGGHVPRFQLVKDKKKADVRVKFRSGASYSELGANALKCIDYENPTMVLDTSHSRIEFTILHEFGHVLSLPHEQQHPHYVAVMSRFLERSKMVKQFLEDNPELTEKDYYLQHEGFPDGIVTPEYYDPESVMHYPTYLDAVKEEFKEKIQDFASVDRMKEQGEIDEHEHKVLRGFIQCLDHNTSKPSAWDKIKVAQAYYNEWRRANPERSTKTRGDHKP